MEPEAGKEEIADVNVCKVGIGGVRRVDRDEMQVFGAGKPSDLHMVG